MAGERLSEISDAAFSHLGVLLTLAAAPAGLDDAELLMGKLDPCFRAFLKRGIPGCLAENSCEYAETGRGASCGISSLV